MSAPGGGPEDVRLRGFSERASLEEVARWIAAVPAPCPIEAVAGADACGRVLAPRVPIPPAPPAGLRAAEDGWAVRAADTVGASGYGPLPLAVRAPGAPLGPAGAALVAAGAPLPEGADAVLPFAAAEAVAGSLEVSTAVAPGSGVEQPEPERRALDVLARAGRPLRPQDAALLVALGLGPVPVVRRPRVRLLLAGAKAAPGAASPPDVDGPLLRALVARDGGEVVAETTGLAERGALAAALAAPGDADLILVVGRTGTGPDDVAPLAVGDAGTLAIHGVALRPGGSAGLGTAGPGAVPVALLPGAPGACLAAYELIAGALVRRLGGRAVALPHPAVAAELGRKLVSAIGVVDVCPVVLADGRAEPCGDPDAPGLAPAVRADGFVVVPAELEGHGPGAQVTVRLHALLPFPDPGAPP
jgi:molybdopterin molybdotransferase